MYAIIEAQGHQYKVTPGSILEVDRLKQEPGDEVVFERVLLVATEDGQVHVGAPVVEGARVRARVKEHFRGPKILVFKYKPRKRYRRRRGHRSELTRLVVEAIEMP
ncbi:MAG: 50S ribosomal protein L21 [Chloroflexi bacterium]|nr:50S ribosomal protein L21 [Chloroflexota bacterium]